MNKVLEIKRTVIESIAPNSNVTFNSATPYSDGIAYDLTTGEITLPEIGNYSISWWINTDTSLSGCIQFSVKSSQGDEVKGCSPAKQGQVVGFADIYARTANVTVSLVNSGQYEVYLSKDSPVTAEILVTHIPEPTQKAFGQIDTAIDAVSLAANVPTIVPMPQVGDFVNIVMAPVNSMTIAVAGYYYLSYSLYPRFVASTPVTLTFAVRSNNADIGQTVSHASTPVPASFDASYIGSTIVHLSAGDVIDIVVTCNETASMTYDNRTISSLILNKID